jgi:hypothetical protein
MRASEAYPVPFYWLPTGRGVKFHMGRKKKTEVNLDDFIYVDAFHQNPQTGQRTKWERHEVSKIEKFRNKWNNFNVFATVQTYKNKTRVEGGTETMYSPLFFDLDSKREFTQLLEEGFMHPSEAVSFLTKEQKAHLDNLQMGIPLSASVIHSLNYTMEDKETGKAVADPNRPVPGALKKFLWLKNLEASRQDTIKIITYFTEKFGLTEDEIRVYFSGQKGFHVLIDPVVLGIQPDKELNKIYKFIMYYLEAQLGLKSIDRGIYSHGRMLRLVNSIHHKSGLFKVELYHTELKGNLEDVLDNLAKAPRPEL